MIAYLFPPIGGGGVQRTVRFAKYLPRFGWTSAVLTVEEKKYKSGWWKTLDPELLQVLPSEISVYRTFSLDWIFQGRPGKLLHYLSRIFFTPDDQFITWLPFALKMGLKIISKEKIDVIYTTSYPYSNHLIGLLLRKITEKPWIADFRDPWTTNPNYRPISRIHKSIDKYLESQIYKNCDFLLTSTDGYRQELLNIFPFVDQHKVHVITNGFDPDDFEGVKQNSSKQPEKCFTITYLAGSSYGDLFLGPFFRGMKLLMDGHPEVIPRVRINLIGENPKGVKSIKNLGLPEQLVSFIDYIPQRLVANYLIGADLLLLLLSNGFGKCIPQKAFLYLAARRPILAIVPEGYLAELIRNAKCGIVVDPKNYEKIAETIYFLFRQSERNELSCNYDLSFIKNFDCRNLTGRLAGLLNLCRSHNENSSNST